MDNQINYDSLDAHQVPKDFFQGMILVDTVVRRTKACDLPRPTIPNRFLYHRGILKEKALQSAVEVVK